MPRLSCWSCGRHIYTVAPLSSLFAEERRCPRCGAFLHEDRRETERRLTHRRTNPTTHPGPPRPKSKNGASKEEHERRVSDRRMARRRGGSSSPPTAASDMAGWQD